MEFLQPEDSMELASSPYMPQDDLDFDLDPMNEPIPAFEDPMVDNATNDGRVEALERDDDDEMVDEDTIVQVFPDNASDLNMETYHEHAETAEDEEILYEDDDVPRDQEVNQQVDSFPDIELQQENVVDHTTEDAEAAGAYTQDDFTNAEQDDTQDATFTNSRADEIAEEARDQPTDLEPAEAVQASDTFGEVDDPVPENHAENQAQNDQLERNHEAAIESGLEIQDATTNTNEIDSTEAVSDRHAAVPDPDNPGFQIDHHSEQAELPSRFVPTVKVIYQDSEICLFPPQNDEGAETFFLSEASLAHESLGKLLASCRDVLADTIGDDDELVLDVASLGLHISEGSKYAAEITLSQILNVYLTLSHNEEIEQVEPLYCNLSSRVCLASQYAYLASAAQEGKTITEITAEHMDSPEFDPLQDQHFYAELVPENDAARDEATGSVLSPLEQRELDYTEQDDHADDAEPVETVEGQAGENLKVTGTADNHEAIDDVQSEDGVDPDQQQDGQQLDLKATYFDNTFVDEGGIQPAATEYQEDIDETADEEIYDHAALEQQAIGGESPHELSTNDEITSSGTIEGEVGSQREEPLEETDQVEEAHIEPDITGDGNDLGISGVVESSAEVYVEHPRHMGSLNQSEDPLHLEDDIEDDLLDLGPEEQDQPPISDQNSTAKIEGENSEDIDEPEDLFAEEDTSTDQTLDHILEDDENVFPLPVTPAKIRSSKRKVESDDEDEFGLLLLDTPDKKRRRPS